MSNRHLPVGTRDEFGPRAIRKENLIQMMSHRFIASGYERVKTPLLEYRDVFQPLTVRGEQPYQMLDDAGEAVVMRPDLRLTDLTLELSDAQFVSQVMQALPLDPATASALQAAFFKKNLSTYQQLIAPLRAEPLYPFLQQWPWLFGEAATIFTQLAQLLPPTLLHSRLKPLQQTVAFLQHQFPQVTITVDLTSQPPQSYYTGLFFHAYASDSRQYLFSGGRYDQLLASFQQDLLPAVGLAFDVDALTDILPDDPKPALTLVYGRPSQWQEAAAVVATTPHAQLCLVDSLAEAKTMAQKYHAKLIDLSPKEAMQ